MGAFTLIDQLTFYGSYHHNKWNQLIHFVFVPTIIWSACVWLTYTGPLLPGDAWASHTSWLPPVLQGVAEPNAALVVLLAYTAFYIKLDVFAGVSWALTTGLTVWLSSTAFRMTVPHAWAWAILVQFVSWVMQIWPGHYVLEKRKPALFDSMFQAFALAPLFVWFEALFLLGYRPELYAELQIRVEEELKKLKAGPKQPLLGATKK
ncbi:MAG: hypothetical protein WDW36_007347 [Sanguina aurantia]